LYRFLYNFFLSRRWFWFWLWFRLKNRDFRRLWNDDRLRSLYNGF